MSPDRRLKPEDFLIQAETEEREKRRGRLKVFLGYASGVGKSYQMFDEARRRRERGEDVVVCGVQPHYSADVTLILQKLEIIPPLTLCGKTCVDVPAVFRRRPSIAFIDGLAYDNPPGSPNAYRWQDVQQLLEAGISVITSVNIQYLEKISAQVEKITGKRVTSTIPRGFLDRSADEIVVVDAPAMESLSHANGPEAELHPAEVHQLSKLRELALLVAAGVIDQQLERYLRSHGMEQPFGVQERIMVCITPRSNAAAMVQSARRNADRFHGELYAIYVRQPALTQNDRRVLRENLSYARQLGAQVVSLNGLDPVEAILKFAREKGITQIYIGQTRREGAWRRLWTNMVDRLIRKAEGIDVSIYPN